MIRRFLLSLGVAVLLLSGLVLFLGPAQLGSYLQGTDIAIFTLGLVAILTALVCWSEASRRLFAVVDTPLSRYRALVAYCTGAFGKQVLPMGNAGGAAVMAYAFNREVDIGYSRSFAVIVVAGFLSLLASLVLGVIGISVLLLFSTSGTELYWLGIGVGLAGGTLIVLAVIVWYRRQYVGVAVKGITRLVVPFVSRVSPTLAERIQPTRVEAALQRYYDTFDTVARDRRAVLSAFALSQVGWLLFALPLYTAALAIDVRLPLELVLFLVPAAGLATVFPLPGGLGGFEVVLVGLLSVLAAIDLASAGAVVILYRLCSFWFFVVVCGIAASTSTVGVRELVAPIDAYSAIQGTEKVDYDEK